MIQNRSDLDIVFSPRSVAVVGASAQTRKPGHDFLEALLNGGFQGSIYPVSPKNDEILGLKAYANLRDIPGPVDYVISCIPAPLVPKMMEDCVAKRVSVVHLYTAAFSETGEEERRYLEAETLRIAREGGIRVIGPNCMGVYCPESGMAFRFNQPKEQGPVAMLSQSGGYASTFAFMCKYRGLNFSKVISYGNAADLNEADFLEYFAQDPKTRVIAAYIEGPRNPRRFLELLKETSKRKPVVILKGGRTSAGTRAVASHTGSLAGQSAIWDAFYRQSGAIAVSSLDELVDVSLAFAYLGPATGRGVGVVGGGGGGSVAAADDCESVGLTVPAMPPDIMRELKRLLPDAGASIGNPIDTSVTARNQEGLPEIIGLVAGYPAVNLLLVDAGVDWMVGIRNGQDSLRKNAGMLIQVAKTHDSKPAAFVVRTATAPPEWRPVIDEISENTLAAGFPVFPSTARAANALSKLVRYHEWLKHRT